MQGQNDEVVDGGVWGQIGQVIAAHVVGLREAAILDDPVAAALLTAMDGVSRAEPPAARSLGALVAAYDERLDALVPAGAIGAAGVARGRAEVVATLLRLAWQTGLLEVARATNEARRGVLDLAEEHVFTLMPAYAGGVAVQPTTFAHFLGGLLGPLGRGAGRLQEAYGNVNRSPLGAVALASTPLPVERERVADLLGFDGIVVNTYDAVAATDHVATGAEAVAAVASALRRFLDEVLTWLRTEPTSFRVAEAWAEPNADAALPSFRPPSGVVRLVALARDVETGASAIVRMAREADFGPSTETIEGMFGRSRTLLENAVLLAERTRELVASGLEVNRAYLANRAGRDHTTSGDLAEFLMLEEGIDPAAARNIAHLTVRRALAAGAEASGITPEMIDAGALLVLGREVGVEVEEISRYLAPRRFLERRTATGAPAPVATRAYLEGEGRRLAADESWRSHAMTRLDDARSTLDRAGAEIFAAVG